MMATSKIAKQAVLEYYDYCLMKDGEITKSWLSNLIQSAIDEATEELTGNVDILKGEIKHLRALCDKYIDEIEKIAKGKL